jgi:hypothetical protein
MSKAKAARTFSVSLSSVKRYADKAKRGESLDSPHRPHQEKGGRSATERDEFLRAAWKVRVAATVEPEKLDFVDECVLSTLPWRPSTATHPMTSDYGFRCREGGARTRPSCWRA